MAFLSRVSVQSVLTWSRAFAKDHDEKPKPTGTSILLELDEMWHYLKKKQQKLWLWKALDPESGKLLDWEGGGRDKTTLQKMGERLAPFNVKVYCPDRLWQRMHRLTLDEVIFVLLQELVAREPYTITQSRGQYLRDHPEVVKELMTQVHPLAEALHDLVILEPVTAADIEQMREEMRAPAASSRVTLFTLL
jgi:IS1 transposase